LSVNPSSLTFTNQQPGVPSAPQTVTVSNTGGSPMANVGFSLTGAAASSYSIAATTCGALLASGSSCTAQIVFTPGATGAIAATLAVSSSTSGVAPVSVPLNGSGMLSSGLTTNPAQIAFPVVAAGQSSTAQPVTVTNSSSYAISAVSLAAAAPFSVTQNTCTGGLAAGANCTASVVFQPSAAGSATGALTVTSSAVATPATVPLSGTGFDFAVSITGSTSQTVAAGQQASFTMIVAPIGSGGAFAFSCGTLPTNALCLFNPSTQTLNAGVQGTVLVEISTGNGATVRLEKPDFARFCRILASRMLLRQTPPGRVPAVPPSRALCLWPARCFSYRSHFSSDESSFCWLSWPRFLWEASPVAPVPAEARVGPAAAAAAPIRPPGTYTNPSHRDLDGHHAFIERDPDGRLTTWRPICDPFCEPICDPICEHGAAILELRDQDQNVCQSYRRRCGARSRTGALGAGA
jgi:hypothetical protein